MPEADLWKRIYESPWHNPGFFWLAGALFIGALALKTGGLRGFLIFFGVEILADCTLTGGLTPIPEKSWLGTPVSVLFVLLGDLRYLLLIETARRGETRLMPALPRAAALSLLVPLLTFGARLVLPSVFDPPRPFFLLYESLFFLLALGQGALTLRGPLGPAARPFVISLVAFEMGQYGLWAFSDVLLLAGVSQANLLRIVPNSMYYAFFLPFVWWRARGDEVPS